MIFIGYFLIYIVRYNLSVHIVDMIEIPLRHFNVYYNETERRTISLTRSGVRILDLQLFFRFRSNYMTDKATFRTLLI